MSDAPAPRAGEVGMPRWIPLAVTNRAVFGPSS